MDKVMEELLLNLTGPLLREYGPSIKSIPERERIFAFGLFNSYTEIDKARRQLEISKILIELSPKKTKRISKQEYLVHTINTFLQEIYIIKLRIDDYIKFIKKMYKKTTIAQEINKTSSQLLSNINKVFIDILKVRGSHVHVKHFEDDFTSTMMSLDFISEFHIEYKEESEWTYKANKIRWKFKTQDILKSIDTLIDNLNKELIKIIVIDNMIVMPSTIIDHKNNQKQ